MALKKTKQRQVFLRSKVARRVFFLFVICAVVPLTALAVFTSRQFSSEFHRQAGERLRQSSKSAGMTVMERLSTLETDMSVMLGDLSDTPSTSLGIVAEKYKNRVQVRFRSLTLMNSGGDRLQETGKTPFIPRFTAEQTVHLRSGKMLAVSYRAGDGSAGVLVAMRMPGPGAELLLGDVQPEYLWGGDLLLSPTSTLVVADQAGGVLFDSGTTPAPTKELHDARGHEASSGNFEWSGDKVSFLAGYWTLDMRYSFNPTWVFVYSENESDVLQPVFNFLKAFLLIVLLSFWIVLWLSLSQIRRTMVPIETLKRAAQRVADKDLSARVDIRSGDEFEDLGRSFNEMAVSLEERLQKISTMNDIGVALSAEDEYGHLLEIIMSGARRILRADGAIVYVVDPDGKPALFDLQIDSLNMKAGPDGVDGNLLAVASVCAGAIVKVDDVYAQVDPEFSGFLQFDRRTGYRTQSFLGVPLRNHEGEIIGFLELINAKDRSTGEVVPFTPDDQHVLESIASQAAVAMTKNKLVADFRSLFEGLTVLIASAIDEKSPYTGEHCKRVPILSMMLADAVCASKEGPFRDFSFTGDELYELKIAALLHDCGKVSTPVHIVDKSRKLETIFDRIKLVETRFEIIRRDKEIELLRLALRAGTGSNSTEIEEETNRVLESNCRQIRNDIEFLRKCNIGAERMPEEDGEEIRRVAARYSWSEDGGQAQPFLSEEEVYNLTITKGTLTPEERKVVEQHVVTTLNLLQALPYPKKLRNVPAYAAAHHERMNGTGYPFGLAREQIAIQGRIIGIADIFEALTAKDRPYKKGKSISEALEMLAVKCRSGHIDPDLFDVFVKEKVYLRYAESYLDPSQIDEVEESAIAI